jgi:hypothetical protein
VLVNHIIPDVSPLEGPGIFFNNDPVTGQAGWYDTRVRIYPSDVHEVWPKVTAVPPRRPAAVRQPRLAYTTHPDNPHATGAPDLLHHVGTARPTDQ